MLKILNCHHRAYLEGNERVEDLPRFLTIETTSICNLQCAMCPHNEMTRPHEHMAMSTYERIMHESAHHVEFAFLHFMGEPLTHPHLPEMITMAEKAGIKTGLSTNANLLDEKHSRALLESPLTFLIISLDAISLGRYAHLRSGGNLEKANHNTQRFFELKKQMGNRCYTTIQMIDLNQSKKEKQAFIEKWLPYTNITIKNYYDWAQQSQQIIKEFGITPPPSENKGRCYEPWRGSTICMDGTVIPCCVDYDATVVLGNIHHQTLKEIWNGKAYRDFRRSHATNEGLPKLCQRCSLNFFAPEASDGEYSPFKPYKSEISGYTSFQVGDENFFEGMYLSFSDSETSQYIGLGWYFPQPEGRWTSDYAEIYLAASEYFRKCIINCVHHNPQTSPDAPTRLEVHFGERLIYKQDIISTGQVTIGPFPIPRHSGKLTLKVSDVFIPSLLYDSKDKRRLGILVQEIILK